MNPIVSLPFFRARPCGVSGEPSKVSLTGPRRHFAGAKRKLWSFENPHLRKKVSTGKGTGVDLALFFWYTLFSSAAHCFRGCRNLSATSKEEANVNYDCTHVSVRQAAKRLGLHVSTVYGLLERGELGFVQCASVKRIPEQELTGFLQRNSHNLSTIKQEASK